VTRDEAAELVMQRWGVPRHGELMAFWGHVRQVMDDPREAERLLPVPGLPLAARLSDRRRDVRSSDPISVDELVTRADADMY